MFTFGCDIVGLVAAAAGGRADGRRGVFAVPVTGFRAGLAACGTVVVSVSGLTRRAGWWRGCWPAGYGGVAARLASVWRRRLRVLGGSPAAARRAVSAWRASKAARMRWLRTASRQAIQRVSGVRPMSRHQPRAMVLLA